MPCNINQNSLTVLPFNHLDDCSFNIALYEMAHGPLHFDADRLDTLLFNPIDESHLDYLTQNLDPNFTFSAISPTSSYMVQDEQWRRHGEDWGGHVPPSSLPGQFSNSSKSGEK